MKKIGLITLYRDNFGSILQAYATYNFVESLGCECKIIQPVYSDSRMDKIKKIPSFLFCCLWYRGFFIDCLKKKKIYSKEVNLLSEETRRKMTDFVNSVFKIDECNLKELWRLNFQYDCFITGSDQVWNGYSDFYFLTFADKEKRIAIAPSFGTNQVKNYSKNKIKRALKGFDTLSVREESGEKIIKELLEKEAVRLADPTVLMSKEEWEKFSKNGIRKEDYILVHFLNKPNEIAIRYINEYLRDYNCAAYCICNKYDDYSRLLRYEFIDVSPYDYVALIDNAKCVFTDSFHSTLFSINLETQFFTFDRQHFSGQTQRSRVIDLLERTNMKNRFIIEDGGGFSDIESETWSADHLFEKERCNLKRYIMKGLIMQDNGKL